MNLTIRYAVPADTPILQTLGKSSYYHHFKELWDCPVELRQFIDSEYAPDQLKKACYMYSENVFRHRGKCRSCETEPQNQRSRAGESAFRDHSGQHKDDYKTTDFPFILFSAHNVYYVKLNL